MGLIELVIAGLCLNATCPDESISEIPVISFRQKELAMLAEELKMETLKITTFNNGELSGYKKKGKELVGKGIAFDIIHILQDKYNFNYTIVAPEDNVFLSSTKKLGAKDMVVSGRADLIAAFLPVINSFHDEILFSRRFDTAEWVVLMKRPRESAAGSGLLAPFTTPVWILIILSLLVVGPIIYLLILVQAKLTRDDNNKVYPLPACVWFVYGALLKQGTTLNPTTDSSRLLFSTWWIFITILTAFYTANLTAFLTLSKFTLPINEPADIKQKRYQWVSNRANGIKDYIKEENKEMLPRGDKLADYIGNGTTFPEIDDMSILRTYVTDRDMMFIREKSVLNNIMYKDYKDKTKKGIDENKRCTYVVAKFPITKFSRAFAFRKNFKYMKLFDSAIQHLVESGIIEHKFVENLPDTEICPLNLGNTERQLRNTDLMLTYLIVAGGLTVAIVVFIIELLIRRSWKKHRRNFRGLPGISSHTSATPLFENNNNYHNFEYIKKITPPPPSYNSLFHPPFNYNNCQKKNINGREYWIVNNGHGGKELIPHRTPSALLFQWSR
nr:ionotropic receptor 15 [Monochamus saltuarius]